MVKYSSQPWTHLHLMCPLAASRMVDGKAGRLPDGVLLNIFKYLHSNPFELIRLRRVSRQWRNVLQCDALWHELNLSEELVHICISKRPMRRYCFFRCTTMEPVNVIILLIQKFSDLFHVVRLDLSLLAALANSNFGNSTAMTSFPLTSHVFRELSMCHKLASLHVTIPSSITSSGQLDEQLWKGFSHLSNSLQQLSIEIHRASDGFINDLLSCLAKFGHLNTLQIAGKNYPAGRVERQAFLRLTRSLALTQCLERFAFIGIQVELDAFVAGICEMPRLRVLTAHLGVAMGIESVQKVMKSCPQLEVLGYFGLMLNDKELGEIVDMLKNEKLDHETSNSGIRKASSDCLLDRLYPSSKSNLPGSTPYWSRGGRKVKLGFLYSVNLTPVGLYCNMVKPKIINTCNECSFRFDGCSDIGCGNCYCNGKASFAANASFLNMFTECSIHNRYDSYKIAESSNVDNNCCDKFPSIKSENNGDVENVVIQPFSKDDGDNNNELRCDSGLVRLHHASSMRSVETVPDDKIFHDSANATSSPCPLNMCRLKSGVRGVKKLNETDGGLLKGDSFEKFSFSENFKNGLNLGAVDDDIDKAKFENCCNVEKEIVQGCGNTTRSGGQFGVGSMPGTPDFVLKSNFDIQLLILKMYFIRSHSLVDSTELSHIKPDNCKMDFVVMNRHDICNLAAREGTYGPIWKELFWSKLD